MRHITMLSRPTGRPAPAETLLEKQQQIATFGSFVGVVADLVAVVQDVTCKDCE